MPRSKKPTVTKKAAAATERVPVTFKTTRELLAQIDALAQREERPRTKVIEMGMRKYVEDAGIR